MYDELMHDPRSAMRSGEMRGMRRPRRGMPMRDPRQTDPSSGVDDNEMESILRLLVSRRVPRFQYGGVVRRPTLGMLGESGPEAVVPLGQKQWRRPRTGAAMAPGATAGAAGDDPLGPEYISRFLRRRAQRTADARRRRAGTLSGLAGFDRMGQRQAMIDADISAGSDLSNELGEADLAGASGFVNYRRQLDRDEREAQRRRQEIEDQRRYEESQRGGIGGFLGEVAGGFLPGIGSGIGRRISGGSRRDPMEDYGF